MKERDILFSETIDKNGLSGVMMSVKNKKGKKRSGLNTINDKHSTNETRKQHV
jgi:hypothetical protein